MKSSNTKERILFLMKERGLKQSDIIKLAEIPCKKYGVKLNKSDLSQYVSGKTEPNQDKLFVLSEALNVNIEWLMGYDESTKKQKGLILSREKRIPNYEVKLEAYISKETHYSLLVIANQNKRSLMEEIEDALYWYVENKLEEEQPCEPW